MCGIVSFSGFKDKKASVDKLKMLMFYNEERGKDSAGFYTKESGVIKKKGKPRDLLISNDFKIPESNQFIGHVRASTVGVTTDANAHPFLRDDIVLVMNGTLTNYYSLLNKYELKYADYSVDSDILCGILGKTKSKDVLSEIDGGCAILYINKENDKLYAYRNSERPLYRGIMPGEGMYMSSIKESLELIGCVNIKEFKENYLYEIVAGEIVTNYKIKKLIPELPIATNHIFTSFYKDGKKFIKFSFESGDYRYNLLNCWLRPNKPSFLMGKVNGNAEDIVLDDTMYYKCIGINTNNNFALLLKDYKSNTKFYCSMFLLSEESPVIESFDYVVSNAVITYTNTKGEVFSEKDDIIKITSLTTKEVGLLNERNDKRCTAIISDDLIRPATNVEIEKYEKVLYSEMINKPENNNPFEVSLNDVEESEFCESLEEFLDYFNSQLSNTCKQLKRSLENLELQVAEQNVLELEKLCIMFEESKDYYIEEQEQEEEVKNA